MLQVNSELDVGTFRETGRSKQPASVRNRRVFASFNAGAGLILPALLLAAWSVASAAQSLNDVGRIPLASTDLAEDAARSTLTTGILMSRWSDGFVRDSPVAGFHEGLSDPRATCARRSST